MTSRLRLLVVSPHPVQHEGPAMRALAARDDIKLTVAYCSLPDPRLYRGAEYLTRGAFDDVPERGFSSIALRNRSPRPSLGRFWGLWNPEVGALLASREFDVCLVYGYAYATSWHAFAAARRSGVALIMSTDATSWSPVSEVSAIKLALKKRLLPWIYRRADVIAVPGSAGQRFIRSLGISSDCVAITPYVVDNDTIAATAARADIAAVRTGWSVPSGARVVLYVGKFLSRKRAIDVLRALAVMRTPDVCAVLVGTGPEESLLRLEAAALGVENRVRFVGLVAYDRLPEAYAAADVVVVPSSNEPWGLPVNEAMVCGRPVVASDRVGSAADLVRDGVTGVVYPCGDTTRLAAALDGIIGDPQRAATMGRAARTRMDDWSPTANADAVAAAAHRAVAIRADAGRTR